MKLNYFRSDTAGPSLLKLCLFALLPFGLSAEAYLKWQDIIGRSFEAKIVEVNPQSVRLENREGKQINFPTADLKPSSREQIIDWQKAAAGDGGSEAERLKAEPSAFDEVLLGNLVRLDGKRLKRCTDATRPKKYYVFYYTASWCPPCRRYTPELVKWYEAHKNENFELVLITSDRNEDAMEDYAKSKKMPWPLLKFRETEDFKKSFDHGVRGIPSLIVCELDGKNLGNFRSGLDRLSKLVQ